MPRLSAERSISSIEMARLRSRSESVASTRSERWSDRWRWLTPWRGGEGSYEAGYASSPSLFLTVML